MTVRPFGTLPDGRHVDLYSIAADGIELHAMTYGGIITSLKVPDRYGEPGEVVLGRGGVEPYLLNAPYNFILQRRWAGLVRAATLHEPRSGRVLQGSTTEPGLQFYDGHLLDGATTGVHGRVFDKYAGLCLEPQHYPDSPHHAHFPTVELRPTERYRSTTRWEFVID